MSQELSDAEEIRQLRAEATEGLALIRALIVQRDALQSQVDAAEAEQTRLRKQIELLCDLAGVLTRPVSSQEPTE